MKHIRKYNESIERENINLSDILITPKYLKYLIHGEDSELRQSGYELIKKDQINFDGEKGYVEYSIIIKRTSDGKFFKGSGEDWGRDEFDVNPDFTEVFPKQKTITVYE